MAAIRLAQEGLDNIDQNIRDYSCTLVKRERIDGKLTDHEYVYMKIRHEKAKDGRVEKPFAVYMYFMGPDKFKGREVLWIEGENDNKMLAHEGDAKPLIKHITASLATDSKMATETTNYSITEIGIRTMIVRLIEVARADMKYGECQVQFFDGAKINGRECKCMQVTHPVRRKEFKYNIARIFIDKELNLPIRYASWTWPEEPGGKPVLFEEFTYLNLKTNTGMTDADFDRDNPEYHFTRILPKSEKP